MEQHKEISLECVQFSLNCTCIKCVIGARPMDSFFEFSSNKKKAPSRLQFEFLDSVLDSNLKS